MSLFISALIQNNLSSYLICGSYFFVLLPFQFHEFLCCFSDIEIKNNKARHNLMNVKYHQVAFRSVDGTVVGSFLDALSQTKVMHSRQIEMP